MFLAQRRITLMYRIGVAVPSQYRHGNTRVRREFSKWIQRFVVIVNTVTLRILAPLSSHRQWRQPHFVRPWLA